MDVEIANIPFLVVLAGCSARCFECRVASHTSEEQRRNAPVNAVQKGYIGYFYIPKISISMNKNIINIGLIAAGLMNIVGVLLFSRAFTNTVINSADPVVMSNFGLLMIMVWGLAYWGAAAVSSSIQWIVAAFAVEKFVYVVVWVMWLSNNSLAQLYAKDVFAGLFFSIYGLNDFIFMLFFLWVFFHQRSSK